jgi:uncharacterized protein YjbI with pentapeptide repeats
MQDCMQHLVAKQLGIAILLLTGIWSLQASAEYASAKPLTQACLGQDFRGQTLERADLRSVNLSNSCFDRAIIVDTDFSGLSLPGASFAEARFDSVGADPTAVGTCSGANFANANIPGSDFRGANLVNACFQNANLVGSRFEGCNCTLAVFRGANLTGARMGNANFSSANFNAATFHGADPNQSNFTEATLCRANFYGASPRAANFTRAKLYQANLYGADFNRSNMTDADLRYANLVGTDLGGANLTGTQIGATGSEPAECRL